MNAESYVGITLWNPHGEAIGLIAVIGRNALVDTRITEMVLKQVAIRAAAELDNRNAEDASLKKTLYTHHSPLVSCKYNLNIAYICNKL